MSRRVTTSASRRAAAIPMIRRLSTAVVAVSLLAGAATLRAQDPVPEEILRRALTLAQEQGPQAALELLAPYHERGELAPPGRALLGNLLLATGRAEEAYGVLEPLSRFERAPPEVLLACWRAASLLGLGEARADLLERAVAAAPSSPAARELGLLRGSQGRLQQGYLALVPWIREHPEDVEARLAAAHMAVELRRVPQAEELLAGLPLEMPRVRLLRARILFLNEDPHGALAILQGLDGHADLPAALDRDRRLTMAHAYLAIGEAAAAVELLAGRQQDDPTLALLLSQAQAQSGDAAGAVASVEPLAAAALRDPARFESGLVVGLLLHYGRQLIVMGDAERAIEPLTLASRLAAENEAVWQFLGQALALSGRRDEAEAALERFRALAERQESKSSLVAIAERDRNDPTGRELRRAIELLDADRASEALDAVRAERRMAPRDPRGALVESRILLALGRIEEALQAAEQAQGLAPDLADVYHQRAVVELAARRVDQAEADFRRALEIEPDHAATLYDLAELLLAEQRGEAARPLLERLLALDPGHRAAAEALQRASRG
jgi:tetratricopeptide (TPR) repeat protein